MQTRIHLLARKHQAALAQLEKESASKRASLEQLLAELRLERRRFSAAHGRSAGLRDNRAHPGVSTSDAFR